MSNTRRPLIRWARWALLLTTLSMGAALMWTAWNSSRRIEQASELLVRGQVGTFFEALRGVAMSHDGPPTVEELEQLLEENEDQGLRYIGLVDRNTRQVVVEAGTAQLIDPADPAPESRSPTIREGSRVRFALPPPPPRPEPSGRSGWRGFRARRPHSLVFEFEATVASELRAAARRTLWLGAGVTGAFMILAAGLGRLLRLREAEEERAERARRLEQLGEMSAVMAHEIRNPLASLKGHAQLLAEQLEEGSKQRKKAERVVLEAQRLEVLSTTLLDFVRSGAVERDSVSPAELAQDVKETVNDSRVVLKTSGAPPSFSLDALRMRQVLANLIRNALEASPEGESVELEVTGEADALVFRVRDRGPGVGAGDEERIFEPFHSGRAQGVGLGLSVARRIVELHQGSLSARNHPQGGAVFEIKIPK